MTAFDKADNRRIRAFSYGGGVQSTAALVLAAQGEIDFPVILFCNVGEDSENPDTLRFVEEYARPYAEGHGIEFHELRHTVRGLPVTLRGEIHRKSGVLIPARLSGGAPSRRICTNDFKIRTCAKWMKVRGATAQQKGVVGLGISVDEIGRANNMQEELYSKEYPLIVRRISRDQCEGIIRRAGLPVPPKSSCYFCPWHSIATWRDLKRARPDLFEDAARIEEHMSGAMQGKGKGPVFLTDARAPLRQAVQGNQPSLFDESDACESGYCMV